MKPATHSLRFSIAAIVWMLAALAASPRAGAQAAEGFSVREESDRLVIRHAREPVAEFVFRDEKILRPFFANIHAPGEIKVTRNHPPIPGVDATDHDTMHPGIWLAFGDVSGVDFWRNKGRIEHKRFSEAPKASGDHLTFATESRLTAPDGRIVCSLDSDFRLTHTPQALLLIWNATLSSDHDFSLGDQEEMGFGVRVATALAEKNGGVITSASGERTAAGTWGKAFDWCDAGATVNGRRIGILLMGDPNNFRPSWWHNRDYGLMVANPFGREAMRQGPRSIVTVKAGDKLRLCFGAAIHGRDAADPPPDLADYYRKLLDESRMSVAQE